MAEKGHARFCAMSFQRSPILKKGEKGLEKEKEALQAEPFK